MTLYENNLDHLREELDRIHRIVSYHHKRWKEECNEGTDNFQGLYISEHEVNGILHLLPHECITDIHADPEYEDIETLTRDIAERTSASKNQGKELRLQILSELFQLQPFEVDVLLISLAPELDLRYEMLYAYMQNDVTKNRPTVDLVLKLFCHSIEERFQAREFFSPDAPLIRNRLIYLNGEGYNDTIPLLSKYIKVDERIISFLLGTNRIDQRIRNFSSKIEPEKSFNDLILGENNKNILIQQLNHHSGLKVPMIFYFHGPYGAGKKTAAEAVCRELDLPMLIVDSEALMKDEFFETLKIVLREAQLQNSSVYLEGIDALMQQNDAGAIVNNLIHGLDDFPNLVFLSGEQSWEPKDMFINRNFISITFPRPPFVLRKKLWSSFLNGNSADDVDIDVLASKFNLSGGQIKDAIFTARNIKMAKMPGEPTLSMEDLYHGCRAQSSKKLTELARKIEPHHTWDDIILAMDTKEQLKEMGDYIKYKGTVYHDWGFDKKLSLGKGLNVLFSGPSGTGKTMAAGIIGGEVGLDLYKIDLSSMVSKYIGETEKNLQKIFEEAETSNAILFFDEADALFGKRSETRDSHDRYANIEINYLLQKMEEHEGIVILATNFKKNIDEAFLRRMHFAIEFPPPDERSREQIWKNIFPLDTPIESDIDFGFLSKFKITGGNIKNIALSAAFLAASNSGMVKIEHLVKATKREFQKMGKLCTSGDFGKYYELVK